MSDVRHGGRLPDPGMSEHPESVRIEIRMSDHTRVVELLPGDNGWPPLKADLEMSREAIEVPNPDGLPWRHFEASPEKDITLKVTCGKATYSRENEPRRTVDEPLAYALIEDEDDSYDVGSHDAVMQVFAERVDAERVMAELIGKVRFTDPYRSRELWRFSDLSIQEMTIR